MGEKLPQYCPPIVLVCSVTLILVWWYSAQENGLERHLDTGNCAMRRVQTFKSRTNKLLRSRDPPPRMTAQIT